MRYLLISPPRAPGAYRGLDGPGPRWLPDESDQHPVNRACDEMANDELLPGVADAAQAVRLGRTFRAWGIDVELIGVARGLEGTPGGAPLGFDVVYFSDHSMLADSLAPKQAPSSDSPAAWELWEVVKEAFRSRLGECGLFVSYPDAALFVRAMIASDRVFPGTFEEPERFRPEVYSVHDLTHLLRE